MPRLNKIMALILTIFVCLISERELLFANSSTTRLDLVIVIDDSGSMERNDPSGLRYTAAKMLVDIASDDDRISIVQFATQAQSLTQDLVLLNNSQKRTGIKQIISDSVNLDIGEDTFYVNALNEAQSLLDTPSGNQRAVIFLTDGLPNEETELILPELEFFINQSIPIYFMMLNAPDIQQDVVDAFEQTGPNSLNLQTSSEIGLAFVFAITQLKPNTYLDPLEAIPSDGQSIQYEIQVSNDQAISDVSFIFIPLTGISDFSVTTQLSPENAELRNNSYDSNYSVFSYENQSTQPISGSWLFIANKGPVQGFAFIHSDTEFKLVYPISKHITGLKNEPLLVGMELIGVANLQDTNLNVQIVSGQDCFSTLSLPTSSSFIELDPIGLSTNGNLYWQNIKSSPNDFSLIFQLSQIDQPIRLRRCFSISSISNVNNPIYVNKPSITEVLVGGRIPLEVQLENGFTWTHITAFIESPSGQVSATELTLLPGKAEGYSNPVSEHGIHIIRFLVEAQNNQLSFLQEVNYEVVGNLCPTSLQYDLGEIQAIDEKLSTALTLDAPLIPQGSDIHFSVDSIRHIQQNHQLEQEIDIQLCTTPQFGNGQVSCNIEITPDVFSIAPGDIEIMVSIDAPEQRICQNELPVRFNRPKSRIDLDGYNVETPFYLGEITPQQTFLSIPINYSPILWYGDPILPLNPEILAFYNTNTEEAVSFEQINLELRSIGMPSNLDYELVLLPSNSLPPGEYSLTFMANAAALNLNTNPEQIAVTFSKPASVIDIEFQGNTIEQNGETLFELEGEVWGIPILPQLLPFLFNTKLYLPATSTTYYLSGEPRLPSLNSRQVIQENDEKPVDTLNFYWRNDGVVQGRPDQFRHTLILDLQKPLSAGTWDISAVTEIPIQSPKEVVFRVEVLGWGAFWWRRLLPLILAIIVFNRISYIPKLQGTLIIEGVSLPLSGRNDLQLTLDNNGNWQLLPDNGDSEVVIRCMSQPGQIQVDFKDGNEPLLIKRGETLGSISYI